MSTAFDALRRLREGTPQAGPAWLGRLRDEAWASFAEAGFPTRRLEAWKSTNLAPLTRLDFARIATRDGIAWRMGDRAGVEGAVPGLRISRLAELLAREPERLAGRLGRLADPKRNALVALATAFLEDGLVIELAPGTRCETPIRIRFSAAGGTAESAPSAGTNAATAVAETATATATGEGTERARAVARFPRLLVLAGEGSAATILVEHAAAEETPAASAARVDAPGLTAQVAELLLAPRAHVALVELQAASAPHIHFSSLHAEIDRSARLDSHVFTLTDALVRSELDLRLVAPEAEATLDGFFLVRGEGHADHFTTVEHAAPHCTSRQEYRGVIGDRGKGVFRGRVIVAPGAQKTNASQSNPNLLLSERAEIDTRPQLEIYADDVRASHGSTIGQLDPDALFFLRARGIGAAEARVLLTRGFAQTIVDGLGERALRDEIGLRVDAALLALEPGSGGMGARPGQGATATATATEGDRP